MFKMVQWVTVLLCIGMGTLIAKDVILVESRILTLATVMVAIVSLGREVIDYGRLALSAPTAKTRRNALLEATFTLLLIIALGIRAAENDISPATVSIAFFFMASSLLLLERNV